MVKRRGIAFSLDALISFTFIMLLITVAITKADLLQTTQNTQLDTYSTTTTAQTVWNQLVFSQGNPPDWSTSNPPTQVGLASTEYRGLISYKKIKDLITLAQTNPLKLKSAFSSLSAPAWIAIKPPKYQIKVTQNLAVQTLQYKTGSNSFTDTFNYNYKTPTTIYASTPYYKILPTATGQTYTMYLPAGDHTFTLVIQMPAYGQINTYSSNTPWALIYTLYYSSNTPVQIAITPNPSNLVIQLITNVKWSKLVLKATNTNTPFTYLISNPVNYSSLDNYTIISTQTGQVLSTTNLADLQKTLLENYPNLDSFSKIVPALRFTKNLDPQNPNSLLVLATLPEPMTYDSPLTIDLSSGGQVKLLGITGWSKTLILITSQTSYTLAVVVSIVNDETRIFTHFSTDRTVQIPWNQIIIPPTNLINPDAQTSFWLWWVSSTGPKIQLSDPDGVLNTFTPTTTPVKLTVIVGR